MDALIESKLDGVFFGWRDVCDSRFEAVTVFNCGLRLAVPDRSDEPFEVPHRLADLADKPCVWFDGDAAPPYYTTS